MFASRSVWYLTASLFTLAFLLYASLGIWFNEFISAGLAPRHSPDAFDKYISAETVDALFSDTRLHKALLSLTDAVAKTASDLGETYHNNGLRDFGRDLNKEVAKWEVASPSESRRRGLIDLFGGAGAESRGGLNFTGKLSGILQEGLASLGGSITDGLATPALFLGIGIGMGAETGLNLTDMKVSAEMATKVAATYNVQPTGLNLVAQNLGRGLTAQISPSLSNSTAFSSIDIGMAAFALAQGIGQGSASGLKLTQQKFMPVNDSSIMGIARNFGLGVASPLTSNIDVNNLFSQAGAAGEQFIAQIPQIAAAAGKGFGEGASSGLGFLKNTTALQKRQAPADPNAVDIPGAVEQFTRGLSQSFLQSVDLKAAVGGSVNLNIVEMLMPIAAGAGQGIGEGAAIGLGFKSDAGLTIMPGNMSSDQSTQRIAAEFSKGLVASFLANGTTAAALANLTAGAGGAAANIQPAMVAEGLARGLVEGSVNAISMAGGIENVLSGNFPIEMAMNMPAMASTNFNDSVNGSAVAFGRGLAGEGTLLIASMITNLTNKAPKRRSLEPNSAGVVPYGSLNRRAGSMPLAMDANMLSGLAQAGTNAITCQGFGGIAAIGLGLINSGTIKFDLKNTVPLDNATLAALPKEPISILSEGNKFEISIQDTKVTVNGMAIVPFAVLTALHIVLMTFAFFMALPAYLALGAIWRISVLIGHPLNEADNKKWRKRILLVLFLPTTVIGMIFGIVGMGKAAHFSTGHGVLGLITFILLGPTIVTSVQRLNTSVPIPSPSAFLGFKQIPKLVNGPEKVHFISAVFMQILLQIGTFAWAAGFSELRAISLCIVDAVLTAPTVVGGLTVILFVQVGAMSIVGLRGWLEQRIAKKEKEESEGVSGAMELGASGKEGKKSDTMKTFGFATHPGTEVQLKEAAQRPELRERNTGQLLGREDSQIGFPTNVRKIGEEDEPRGVDYLNDNPFINPTNTAAYQTQKRRTYNEKTGGYETAPNSEFGDRKRTTAYRPSSDIIVDNSNRYSVFTVESPYAYQYGEERPPLPRKSEDRDLEESQRYKSFSRLTKERQSEEISVGFPGGGESLDTGKEYGNGVGSGYGR